MNEFNITVQMSVDVLFHITVNPQRHREFLYYNIVLLYYDSTT